MKFHWTTAVIQILSHLLLPLFCWLCLLHQQPPPQQRFGDKTGMPRTGTFTTLSSFRFPFIVSTIPFGTHPAENHQAMGSDYASHLLSNGKTQSSTYFSIPRLHSWQDQEWIILSSLIVGLLHARLCEEHDSRRSQTKRKSRKEQDSYAAVCETAGPRRTLGGPGKTLTHGPHHLHPELKNQSVLLGAGPVVDTFFLVHRIVY